MRKCGAGVGALGVWRSRPTVALTGSTPGCRPPLRMTREVEVGYQRWCARRLEVPTCGRPDGFDSGLSPSAQDDTRGGVGCQRWCARRLEIPTYGRPPGSTSGCRPPLRMTREAEVGCQRWCARRLEIPTCGRPDGFDSGLRPPLRMTRRGGFMLFQCGGDHYTMVAPALFINI